MGPRDAPSGLELFRGFRGMSERHATEKLGLTERERDRLVDNGFVVKASADGMPWLALTKKGLAALGASPEGQS